MQNAGSQRPFTAELRRRKNFGGDDARPPMAPAAKTAPVGDTELLREIRLMHDEMRAMHKLLAAKVETEQHDAEADAEAEKYERQREEMQLLKMELRALANSIQETKKEIAALRTNDEESDRLIAVTSELDAVVGSTERATDGILDAAEKIDAIAHNMKASKADKFTAQLADEIIEHVMTVFEHCNFQDITGQRINKVVGTLKFVEDRVDKMIEIWGREAFEDLIADQPQELHDPNDERHLLNGPALDNKGISQSDIDALFD